MGPCPPPVMPLHLTFSSYKPLQPSFEFNPSQRCIGNLMQSSECVIGYVQRQLNITNIDHINNITKKLN